jgi:catechol 2,3-dioxygenase-like lactoylglutathione lyase family enzyme
VTVADLEASLRFYRDVLGFRPLGQLFFEDVARTWDPAARRLGIRPAGVTVAGGAGRLADAGVPVVDGLLVDAGTAIEVRG